MRNIFIVERKTYEDVFPISFKRYKNWVNGVPSNNWTQLYRRIAEGNWNFLHTDLPYFYYPVPGDDKVRIHDFDFPDAKNGVEKIVSCFPNSECITEKDNLLNTLSEYAISKNLDLYEYIPVTFILDKSEERLYFLDYYELNPNTIWIYKPKDSYAGKGIYLLRDLTRNKIMNLKDGIIQEYIQRPILYSSPNSVIQRKFDIRVMSMLHYTGKLQLYMYPEGFVRLTGKAYTLDDLDDVSIHVTNHAIQETQSDYQKFERGNLISFKTLFSYLKTQGFNSTQIFESWKSLVTLPFLASKVKIMEGRNKRLHPYQIYGIDLMIYTEGNSVKTKIIEVNHNPTLIWNTQWADRLSQRLVDEMLDIILNKRKSNNQWILLKNI